MSAPPKSLSQSTIVKKGEMRYLVLSPFIGIIILTIGYFVVVRGQIKTLRDLRARQSVERISANTKEQIDRIARVEQDFAKISKEDREAVDLMVPAGEDVPGLFVIFDTAAQHAGVSVTSMDVTRDATKDLTATGGARILSASIAIRNVDYQKIKSFLSILSSSQRLLDVLTVQFSPQGRSASIQVRAYTID